MKILFDTSVIVASMVEAHSQHEKALPWLQRARANEFTLIVASHTMAELYAVLTSMPVKPRISPRVAWKLIQENIVSIAKIESLNASDYRQVIKEMADAGHSGGMIYDALIARAGYKAEAEKLLTMNPQHFRKVWQGDEMDILSL